MVLKDGTELLSALQISSALPKTHQVFELNLSQQRLQVPAVVLLSGLVGPLFSAGQHLLRAGSLDRVAIPLIHDQRLSIAFAGSAILKNHCTKGLEARYVWLTSYPSARRLWNSVHINALKGLIGLTPPLATIGARFYGVELADTMFVTHMSVRTLTPNEHPFEFARHFVPATFDFGEYTVQACGMASKLTWAALGERHPAKRNRPVGVRDPEIRRGNRGWKMTAMEWRAVIAALKQAGFGTKSHCRPTIDVILQKLGTGRTWTSFGANANTAKLLYCAWRRTGKWQVLKQVLGTLRSDSVASAHRSRRL